MESGLIVSRAEAEQIKDRLVMEVLAGCMSVSRYDWAMSELNRLTVPR